MHDVKDFLPIDKIKLLKQQQYALFGHSAVKICHYTKTAISEGRMCYKFKFYGINSHQCIQMTPASNFCNQECSFCWRTLGWTPNDYSKMDAPKEIVDESKVWQRKQLSGFGGNSNINQKLFDASKTPQHVAISLTGEPTLYPLLPQLIEAYHDLHISTFLVSNGSRPEVIEKINPTQLYISMDALDEKTFLELNRPKDKETAWQNLLKTLDVVRNKPCRSVLRMTCVKGINMHSPEGYAKLIERAQPWFVEVKGYSWIGFSRYRLKHANTPTHIEVGCFADEIAKCSGYVKVNEDEESRNCLLVRSDLADKSTRIDFKKFFERYDAEKAVRASNGEITASDHCTCHHADGIPCSGLTHAVEPINASAEKFDAEGFSNSSCCGEHPAEASENAFISKSKQASAHSSEDAENSFKELLQIQFKK